MRKFWAILVAALLGAAISGAIASAGSSITAPTEIDTVEANKVEHDFDNGKAGFSIGDVAVISTDLNDATTGDKLGHMHETCTVIHAKNVSLECVATAELEGGQISIMGEFPPVDDDASYSVTGGTGTYDNVGGMMTIGDGPEDGVYALTFFLVP
jgi:hypothetical protein